MIKYGRIIFEVLPDETTHTLIALCTDWTVGKKVQQAPAPGTISGPPGEREGEREGRREMLCSCTRTPLLLY